jgi:hypothetical protein
MSLDELLYDLIFSEQDSFKIDISNYIDDIYEYKKFISNVKKILRKSKVNIIDDSIDMDSKTVIWEIKVKK